MEGDDPITLSMAAVAGGAAMSAGGSVIGGMNEEAAKNIEAEQQRQQASQTLTATGAKISADDYNAGKVISSGVAQAGASGATVEGAMPVISEDYSLQKIKDMYTSYSGKTEASNLRYGADLSRYQGKQAFIKGIFGGVQSILGGAANIGALGVANGNKWPNIGIGSGGPPTP